MPAPDLSLTFDPAPPWATPIIGPLALCTVAIALAIVTFATYRGSRVPRQRVAAVIALRLIALVVAVLTVLRPALAIREDERTPSTLIFALDSSKSMSVTDEVDDRSRWDMMTRLLRRSENALNKLRDEYNVTVKTHYFADEMFDEKKSAPDGPRTDFGQMLRTLAQRYGQERALRGLVIVSDGADNGARYPAQGEAARFRALNCPVYTFSLGKQTTSPQQRDIAVVAASADPSPVPVKGKLAIKATIDAPGFENSKVVVRLMFDGKEVMAKEQVLPGAVGNEVVLETNAPSNPGEVKVTVKVDPRAGEASVVNNELTTYLTVSKEGLSVLVIDRLRIELKYIRRALVGDPRIRVFEAIRQTDDPPRGAAAELYRLDQQAYDVIIIGDMTARRLRGGDPAILEKIEELVRVKGVGLLMLGGDESFSPSGWQGTAIAAALPVELESAGQAKEPVRMVPAPGLGGDYLMKIAGDAASSAALWNKLPTLPGFTRLGRRKEGATTVGQTTSGTPLLVRQNYGAGRTAAFALDMTYLWQQLGQTQRPPTLEGIDAHSRFWRQLILYLGKQEETEGSVWVKPDMRRVPAGGKVTFGVGVRGKTGLDLKDAQFDVKVKGPDGIEVEAVKTTRERESDRGTIWKTEKPGEYRIEVKGTAKDADSSAVAGEAVARFLVYQDDTELLRPAADHELLARLATAGGGQAFRGEELIKFLDDLGAQPLANAGTKTRYLPDWRSAKLGLFQPALFALFVLLLGLEWGLRRWWGMV